MKAKISVFDAVKIQARIVLPIVKALERELGKERAYSIVGQAIADANADWQGGRIASRNTHPRENNFARDFDVETEIAADTDSTFAMNVTRCQFAEYFRKIGETEIGALLTCGLDFSTQAKLRPDWELGRTQTLMNGAPCCDFKWRLRTHKQKDGDNS